MDLLIRELRRSDARVFEQGFAAQGWQKPAAQFIRYLDEEAAGKRKVFVAEWNGQPAGYVTLVFEAESGPFAGQGIPEIVDFNVLERFQRNGIGRALLDAAETLAAKQSDRVCLGVGLHAGYGPAQRTYIKRGYIPDGSGIWYDGKPVSAYTVEYPVDDSLALYLSKQLR